MTDAELFAQRLSQNLVKTKMGSLRFWGQWFGRPYDNIHRLVGCEGSGHLLRLLFNEGETLTVWSPSGLVSKRLTFQIADAARVRWEWFSYGRPKIAANLFYMDFAKERGAIIADTSWTFSDLDLNPNQEFPAVEILSYADKKPEPDLIIDL